MSNDTVPMESYALLLEQRDELLAALEAMVAARDRKPHSPSQATKAYIKACAAIANVKA